MKQPPYHLRLNKAVDRLMLIEALRRIGRPPELEQYIYYGLGGPYLEDFRLMHDYFPEISMVSIEADPETYKRQRFHKPCDMIELKLTEVHRFLAEFHPGDQKCIFWLDQVGLNYGDFVDFMVLVSRLSAESVIKITLKSDHKIFDYAFIEQFRDMLPTELKALPNSGAEMALIIQEMLHIAVQRTLPTGIGMIFQPISSFFYNDGAPMYTLTGILSLEKDLPRFRGLFSSWQFANLDWSKPLLIDMPILTAKERLHLQRYLPISVNAGESLRKILDYDIDDTRQSTEDKLQQYADFYRYYPLFIRAIP